MRGKMVELTPIKKIKENFPDKIEETWQKSSRRTYVTVKKDAVKDIVSYLMKNLGARFIIITALDTRKGIEMLYHFSFDQRGCILSIRTFVPMPLPEIESIAQIISGAEYIEREIHDLLGVNFKNHPNLKRFILADDWPEGLYPLRREHKCQFPYRTVEEQNLFRQEILKKEEQ